MPTTRPIALLLVAILAALPLAACSSLRDTALPIPGPKMGLPAVIRLGSLPTEDDLPLWAARQQGVFDKVGVTVRLVPFSSVHARDAALESGAIDGFVGDMFAVARLWKRGVKTRIVTICLGTTPTQSRVGLVSAPGSHLRFARELTKVPIATSLGGLDEFVLDGLMRTAAGGRIVHKQGVEQASARFDLLVRKKIKAAVLPEPYLTLALRRRAHLIASDTKGANLSQTVIAVSSSYLARPDGLSAVNRLLGAWDTGSSLVDSHRAVYRPLLISSAHFPSAVVKHYRMNSYPHHQLPTPGEVSAVLTWIRDKKLLRTTPTYAEITWQP